MNQPSVYNSINQEDNIHARLSPFYTRRIPKYIARRLPSILLLSFALLVIAVAYRTVCSLINK